MTIPFRETNFRPSCSRKACSKAGPSPSTGAPAPPSGVHSKVKSNVPLSHVRSTIGRPRRVPHAQRYRNEIERYVPCAIAKPSRDAGLHLENPAAEQGKRGSPLPPPGATFFGRHSSGVLNPLTELPFPGKHQCGDRNRVRLFVNRQPETAGKQRPHQQAHPVFPGMSNRSALTHWATARRTPASGPASSCTRKRYK